MDIKKSDCIAFFIFLPFLLRLVFHQKQANCYHEVYCTK